MFTIQEHMPGSILAGLPKVDTVADYIRQQEFFQLRLSPIHNLNHSPFTESL
jgi:hypothetical protein